MVIDAWMTDHSVTESFCLSLSSVILGLARPIGQPWFFVLDNKIPKLLNYTISSGVCVYLWWVGSPVIRECPEYPQGHRGESFPTYHHHGQVSVHIQFLHENWCTDRPNPSIVLKFAWFNVWQWSSATLADCQRSCHNNLQSRITSVA